MTITVTTGGPIPGAAPSPPAIGSYDSLKSQIQEWMDRSDITGNIPMIIGLAEARLNRVLKVVETDVSLSGVAGERALDISALSIVQPIALKIKDLSREYDVIQRDSGDFNYIDITGRPMFYCVEGSSITLDRLQDQPYHYRFRYQGRFALNDAAPSNRLLEDHPDVYLAACLVWGGLFTQDDRKIATWKGLLDEYLAEAANTMAQAKRTVLTADPMLQHIGRPRICR